MELKNIDSSRRSFSRVRVSIPLEATLLANGDLTGIKSRLARKVPLPDNKLLPDLADHNLRNWLILLNSKLDHILNALAIDQDEFGCLSKKTHNIGGGGLSFLSPEAYREGDVLEIKLLLESSNPMAAYFYGKVVNIVPQADEFLVSVEFISIDESIREEIIKFVFEREREVLREKRR